MPTTQDLAARIDAEFSAMETKLKAFQAEKTREHQDWERRLEKLGATFDRLREVWKPRIETLVRKFGDKVSTTPAVTPSTRDVTLEFQSELARIRLRLRATTDHEITKLILCYDLEIIPILTQFESHAELEQPLEAIDPSAIGRWIDDRILAFVKTYIALHENQYYLRDSMVEDPIAKVRFPRFAAGATLQRDGRTIYFVSEETRRQYAAREAAQPK